MKEVGNIINTTRNAFMFTSRRAFDVLMKPSGGSAIWCQPDQLRGLRRHVQDTAAIDI